MNAKATFIIKNLLLLLLFSTWLTPTKVYSQSWFTVYDSTFQVSFPDTSITINDTLNLTVYSYTGDTTYALIATVLDSADFQYDSTMMEILQDSTQDLYELFAKSMVLLSGGEIVGFLDITAVTRYNFFTVQGREIVHKFYDDDEGINMYNFHRIFYINNKFVCFSASIREDDLVNYQTLRDNFFSSIMFNM